MFYFACSEVSGPRVHVLHKLLLVRHCQSATLTVFLEHLILYFYKKRFTSMYLVYFQALWSFANVYIVSCNVTFDAKC